MTAAVIVTVFSMTISYLISKYHRLLGVTCHSNLPYGCVRVSVRRPPVGHRRLLQQSGQPVVILPACALTVQFLRRRQSTRSRHARREKGSGAFFLWLVLARACPDVGLVRMQTASAVTTRDLKAVRIQAVACCIVFPAFSRPAYDFAPNTHGPQPTRPSHPPALYTPLPLASRTFAGTLLPRPLDAANWFGVARSPDSGPLRTGRVCASIRGDDLGWAADPAGAWAGLRLGGGYFE